MVKQIISVLFLVTFSCAVEILDIKADKISSDAQKGLTTIRGNVEIKKGKDILYADEVEIKTDIKRKPTQYRAFGNVKFEVMVQERKMKGSAKEIIYDVLKDEYLLNGDAFVQEIGTPNMLKGEKVVLSSKKGYADIVGDTKRPAKIIFTLDEKQ